MGRTLEFLHKTPVSVLKGVGPKKLEALKHFEVDNVLQLVMTYPRRYVDRSREGRIRDLEEGVAAMVVGTVQTVNQSRTHNGKNLVKVIVNDGSGSMVCTFFNQPWRARQLAEGTDAVFFGKLERFNGRAQMTNPGVDLIGSQIRKILPIYPQSDKVSIGTRDFETFVSEALVRAGVFLDPLPSEIRERLNLIDRTTAFRLIHQPDSMAAVQVARTRLVFDELLRLQTALVLRKRAVERDSVGVQHHIAGKLVNKFHEALPYKLTKAQRRAVSEIYVDLGGPTPMHRLLQGDVGAGKTVVAVSALLVAVQGGHQGALMAPTEVLAEQHALSIANMLGGLTVPSDDSLWPDRPLNVRLLTGRVTAVERRKILAGLADGSIDIVIGTHALIQESVVFKSLGVVVVDEQHRFGVEQRAMLRDKGANGATPDVLVMTATPIPRTAAMTVYGDLDVSILDELPPGRTPIVTQWAGDPEGSLGEHDVWAAVKAQVSIGHQAYVVCPLVEGSDKLEVRSAEETYEELTGGVLHGLRLGLLHGRMKSAEKEAMMTAFRGHDLDVLVATTVIEVGVDVPNASVMVILDAGRFGIAQLHQLRGRVGRGAAASSCYLVTEGEPTPDGQARLEALVASTDGFALAEVDLDLRGEGTILGVRQQGRNDLQLASLKRDRELVATARAVAFEIVDNDPGLVDHPDLAADVRLIVADADADWLFKS